MKVAITGASGMVGSNLQRSLLSEGNYVYPLVRRPAGAANEIFWNPKSQSIDAAKLEGIDAIVHLAGENLNARRWNKKFKEELRASRVDGTRLIAGALAKLSAKPRVFISASALGFYGDRGEEILNEKSPAGKGFLAELAQEWEAAAKPAADAGIRTVNLRIGVVMSTQGGALKKMLPPFKLGMGGKLGSGKQWVSWIALPDLISIIKFVIADDSFSGPVNAVSPNPVTNEQMSRTLAGILGRPCFLNVPTFTVRVILGEMADETVLVSSKLVPQKLLESGFKFDHPELKNALEFELQPAL